MIDTMTFEFDDFPAENQFQTLVDYDTDKIYSENFLNSDLILTESQNELVEKFNAAFVEAQNTPKPPLVQNTEGFPNIFDPNFEEGFYEEENSDFDTENSNFLLDIFLAKDANEEQESVNEIGSYGSSSYECSSQSSYINLEEQQNFNLIFSDESLKSSFYIPPPFKQFPAEENREIEENSSTYENFEDLNLSDIDLCENLSNSSFDIATITTELCDGENYDFDYENAFPKTENSKESKQFVLPSVSTIGSHFPDKKYSDLDNFLRNSSANTINIFAQVSFVNTQSGLDILYVAFGNMHSGHSFFF